MSALPPRASFVISPNLRTPDTDQNGTQAALSLVPLTTRDPSPANSSFGRSPLSSLGTNTNSGMGLGIRQRRQHPPSPFFNGDTVKGPPRASLTMSMGGSHGSGMVAPRPPSVKNDVSAQLVEQVSWILVYGFGNQEQCEEVLRKFKAYGAITWKMPSGNKNWVAFQFDNPLTVEKAAAEKRFQLSDGCFCAVQKLPKSQDFFYQQQRRFTTVLSHDLHGDNNKSLLGNKMTHLFPPAPATKMEEMKAEISEADILMGNPADQGPARGRSVCEAFFSWIYGW